MHHSKNLIRLGFVACLGKSDTMLIFCIQETVAIKEQQTFNTKIYEEDRSKKWQVSDLR